MKGLKCRLLKGNSGTISVVVKQKFLVAASRIIKMFLDHTSLNIEILT
jgi:hypothetical protein